MKTKAKASPRSDRTHELCWLHDDEDGGLPSLLAVCTASEKPFEGYTKLTRQEVDSLPTLDIAKCLDQEAENENNHGFCGAHVKLAEIVAACGTIPTAKAVMVALAERGGLMNLGG